MAGNGQVAEARVDARRLGGRPAAGMPAFAAAVEQFAEAQWRHMNLERKVILPAAQAHLTAEDWTEILRAFSENGDPRFSVDTDGEFRRLFAAILDLAPAHVVGGADRGPG